jgi:hypothetical protein
MRRQSVQFTVNKGDEPCLSIRAASPELNEQASDFSWRGIHGSIPLTQYPEFYRNPGCR